MKFVNEVISNQKEVLFESLYKDLQPRLYAFCRKFIDDPEVARDLVQDAFIKLWEDVDISIIQVSVAAYLRKTVQNLCLLYLRSRQIHERYETKALLKLKEVELNFFLSEDNTYTPIFLKDIEDIIEKCIEDLPEQSRRIFKMSRHEGLSHAEIAERLNISVRTVENHIYRSLTILKTVLNDYLIISLLIILMTLTNRK